jgi:membrane associated rhomboid family serine protease
MATCYRHPDRETGLSCSECGRPICTDCMTVAPVGIRCPEHSGAARSVHGVRATTRVLSHSGSYVTRILIAVNVGVYLLELAGGSGIYGNRGYIFEHGALVASGIYSNGAAAGVAHGEWWRLITSAFLHYGPLHLGLNMLALYWFGTVVEGAIGHLRFLVLYLVSGLAGAAGALILNPNAITVGASGAIFGVLGAMLILEYLATGKLTGNAMTLIVINLAFSFAFSANISVGGHLGGLVAGILCTLAFASLRHYRSAAPGIAIAVVIAALSVVIAFWRAHGLA